MFPAPTAPAPAPAAPVLPPSSPPPVPITPPTRRASRKPLAVFVVLLVLVALGVGGYFAYGAWQQASNPQAVVEAALAAADKIRSASVTFTADATIPPAALPSGGAAAALSIFKLAMEGSYARDPQNPQVDGRLTLTLPVALGPLGAKTLNPKISVRMKTAEAIYVRVDQVPPLPFFDLSKVSGQWVKINMGELKQKYGVLFDLPPKPDESSAAQGEKVAEIYHEHPFLVLTRLAAEAVDGAQADHLGFSLDREQLKDFLNAMAQEMGQSPATPEQLALIDELFDQGLAVNGELWIGQRDHFLRQVTGALATNVPDLGKLTANLRATFTGINQPVTVEEPTDAISLDEVMQRMQSSASVSGALNDTGVNAWSREDIDGDGTVDDVYTSGDTDGDGLDDVSESFIGSSPSKMDTDGDGFPDGEEVAKGYNPAGTGKLTPQQEQVRRSLNAGE